MKQPKIKICKLSCHFLKYSLIWPNKNEEFRPSKKFYIKQLLFIGLLAIPNWLLLFSHLVLSLREGTIDVSEDFAIFTAFFSYVGMMTMYVIKQKHLASLLLDLSDFRTYSKPPLFDSVNKKLEYFVKFIFYYAINATLIYNALKIVNIPYCRRMRKIRETCGTLTPVWTPFDTDHWLTLIITILYVFSFYVTVDRGIMFVALQCFEIASNIKLQIDQLNSMLLHCFEGHREADKKRLNSCIRYHNLLIGYCERFNKCFINEMFMFLATTGMICACLENQILKQLNLGAILHICGWIESLFLACLSGQILIDSSTSVGQAAYNSKWYNADPDLRRALIPIIMRSQKPLFLETGPFNVLSFSLFVSIMKLSYSILALLR